MKSIQTKIMSVIILGMVILTIVITAVSAIYISDILETDSDIITEAVSDREALGINEVLNHVISSAHMMETYMQATIESAESIADEGMRDIYTAKAKEMFFNIAQNTEGVIAFYFRYNPELAGPKEGFFVSALAGGKELIERDTTDLTDWQNAPHELVGWYADPVTLGKPIWSTKYHNQSSSTKSISYVVPFYKDFNLCGVIGIEVDSSVITSLVDNISVYENGFAYLKSNDGMIYYSPVSAHLLDKTHTNHGFAEEHNTLENGMELVIHADYSDIQHDSYSVMFVILGSAALILVVFILLTYYTTSRIVKPLELLAKSAEELAEGSTEVNPVCNTNDEIGVLAKAISLASDKIRNYRKHINAIAYRDSLTGVKNSTAYNDATQDIDKRIKEDKFATFSVVVADVNMLKATNDEFGHDAGNQLLVSASRLICSTFKRSPVFRIGGDEFVAILENDDYQNRYELMSEINEKYHELPDKVANDKVDVTVACGISDFTPGMDSCFADVFNRADAAMYIRKQNMKCKLQKEE